MAAQKKRKPARRRRQPPRTRTAPVGATDQPAPFVLPGRRTMLTEALAKEISDRIAGCASFKDACALSGVLNDTGLLWMERGRSGAMASGDNPGIYVQFLQMVEGANSRRRTMLKALIRRAATGTATKPGDWRASQALGAMTDPAEFVPQLRVHVERQLDGVLDALANAFKDDPENHAKALQAVVGASAPAAIAPADLAQAAEPAQDEAPGGGTVPA